MDRVVIKFIEPTDEIANSDTISLSNAVNQFLSYAIIKVH